jgi:hypothetical protein
VRPTVGEITLAAPKVSLFNFPKDKDLKARWVQAIKRQGENGKSFVPTASSKVRTNFFV